jgi:hypothetical protein
MVHRKIQINVNAVLKGFLENWHIASSMFRHGREVGICAWNQKSNGLKTILPTKDSWLYIYIVYITHSLTELSLS